MTNSQSTSRLRFSEDAYLRKLQISGDTLFVYVEGRSDRYAYSQVIDAEVAGRMTARPQIITSKELPDGGGGKEALLKFFRFLEARSALIIEGGEQQKLSLFFVDKDIDDLLEQKLESRHVVYTESYEIENYYFLHGDIYEAAASAASLDVQTPRQRLPEQSAWCRNAAELWRGWVTICVLAHMLGDRESRYFSRPCSQVQVGDTVYGELDKERYQQELDQIQHRSGLDDDEFHSEYKKIERIIDEMYARNRHDSIFKGKWHVWFLIEDLENISGDREISRQGLKQRILHSLPLTLDPEDEWASDFRSALNELMDEAGMH